MASKQISKLTKLTYKLILRNAKLYDKNPRYKIHLSYPELTNEVRTNKPFATPFITSAVGKKNSFHYSPILPSSENRTSFFQTARLLFRLNYTTPEEVKGAEDFSFFCLRLLNKGKKERKENQIVEGGYFENEKLITTTAGKLTFQFLQNFEKEGKKIAESTNDLLPGVSLLAPPSFSTDDFFFQSILFLTKTSLEEGAEGLVLNSISKYRLRTQDDKSSPPLEHLLFLGGPVGMTENYYSLRMQDEPRTLQFDFLEDDKDFFRMFTGLSTWTPGQLERELESGYWILCKLHPDLFSLYSILNRPATYADKNEVRAIIWEAIMRSLGGECADFARYSTSFLPYPKISQI